MIESKTTSFDRIKNIYQSEELTARGSLMHHTVVMSDNEYLSDMQKNNAKALEKARKADTENQNKLRKKQEEILLQMKIEQKSAFEDAQRKGDIKGMEDAEKFMKKTIDDLKNSSDNDEKVYYEQIVSKAKAEYDKPSTAPIVNVAPQPGVLAPVRATEQPGAIPTPGQQANGGGYTPPPQNKPNQYTFADGHKEYDSTAIPDVLQKGKITPARYFAMNGMNFIRDAKKLAAEMGITNYRGTPGENYALVNYLEEKKNGNPTAGGEQNRGSNRKFDGIQSDVLPNRFTQEERDKVMAMTPEEQAKYVSERNVADLKKMLYGNVGLINKVFGTNYTSDDLTGGIGRATIMGSGMTAKGMEIQNLINSIDEKTASKFMNKGGELDNAIKDDSRIETGSIQSGRRVLLEEMVDGKRPMGQGTTIDEKDQEYMDWYKGYKRVKANADKYNQMVNTWNNTDPNNVVRNKQLVAIQQFVNNMKDTDPESYNELKEYLDKIPEFTSKGGTGKLPNATIKNTFSGNSTENGTNTGNKKIEIAPANNNNIPENNPVKNGVVGTQNNNPTNTPIAVDPTNTPAIITPQSVKKESTSSGGYYSQGKDTEFQYGYSSNLTSKG